MGVSPLVRGYRPMDNLTIERPIHEGYVDEEIAPVEDLREGQAA